jgi:hypothetical protein
LNAVFDIEENEFATNKEIDNPWGVTESTLSWAG